MFRFALLVLATIVITKCTAASASHAPQLILRPAVPAQGQQNRDDSFPCPVALDIAPCVCTVTDNTVLSLDCSDVTSETQLSNAFQQEFPSKYFQSFTLSNNDKIYELGNIFNDITFREFKLFKVPNLSYVSQYLLFNSQNTLESISIFKTKLRKGTFPFTELEEFSVLNTFYISNSKLHELPSIRSKTIQLFDTSQSVISHLDPDTFTFTKVLRSTNLGHNNISALQADTFRFTDVKGSSLDLSHNNINAIAPGTFVIPSQPIYNFKLTLWLQYNQITLLDEAVFKSIFPYIESIDLYHNPLSCGCEVLWLISEPNYMDKISNYTHCADGRKLVDLDPVVYQQLC